MEKQNPVHHPYPFLLSIMFLSFVRHSHQLQPSQSQSLQQLLHYPLLPISFNTTTDLCNIEPTLSLILVCYEDNITQLHIIGNNNELSSFPQNFSTEAFFAILTTLSSLKVLSLVSLGLWGPLPATIGQLSSLEILNVSSNHFTGAIPYQLSSLRSLQTLILDHNKFTGQVPGWLSSLPVLAVLCFQNNLLSGSLPNAVTSLENLRILSVSRNHLSGEVPDLRNLTNLQVIDLQDNYFGPHFPSFHSNLVTLVLRNNSFQFNIASELVSYYQLQTLDISMNAFVGPFLPSLLSLPSLTYIDISQNKFTGMLFENMSCSVNLAYADLSSNLLSGDLPACLKSNSQTMVVLYGGNCLSNQEQKQHHSNFCHSEALAVKPHDKEKQNRPYGKTVLASSTIGGTIGAIAIVGVILLIMRRFFGKHTVKKPQGRLIMENVSTVNIIKLLSEARYISETMKLGASLPPYRTFAFEELKEATNNFDDSNLLGDAPHSKIYRGNLGDGTLVAIRSLAMKKKHYCQQIITHHIEFMSKLRHSHLVSALGHCLDCHRLDDSSITKIFLIFEFVPNGTLRDYISGIPGKRLNWKQRIRAAIGVTKGIQFLHTGFVPGVFSNNLKITDVLLDQDLHVKVSRYNLPLLADSRATIGAAVSSPALKQSILTREKDDEQKDVYDLGIILAEIIVGRPIMSFDVVAVVKDILQVSITIDEMGRRSIVDPAVGTEFTDESLKIMMGVCIRCLAHKPSDRPSVEDILWNLQFAVKVEESWKGDSQESNVSCSKD